MPDDDPPVPAPGLGRSPSTNPIEAFNAAMREAGLWGALPWASATSTLLVGGLLLGMVPMLGCVGWVGAAIGLVLLGFLGFGGVVTRPWSRALLGVAVGELAAFCTGVGSVGGVIAAAQAGVGGVEIFSFVAMIFAGALAAAWAHLRWEASVAGIAVTGAWALLVCALPWTAYTLAYVVFGQSIFLPY